MANIKKIVKVVKKTTEKKKATPKPKAPVKKKPLTPKQKTYQIRGAGNKREIELEIEGGRPSRERIAELRKIAFPHLYE